jgi:hypothetical protein
MNFSINSKMDKYLIQLLKEVNTIIIPGIGAFTVVNKTTGEVMFLPFMKFDDEKLATHIAEKEGWGLNDAKNLVAKYVRDINAKLTVGDTYDIYQFGSFSKKTGEDIEFTAWNGTKSTVQDETVTDNISDENDAVIVVATETITEINNEIIPDNETIDNVVQEIKSDSNFSFEVDTDNITEATEKDIESISDEPISIELENLDFNVEQESIDEKEVEIPKTSGSEVLENSNEINSEISTSAETTEPFESVVEKALEIEKEKVVIPETTEIIEKIATVVPAATAVLSVEEQMNDDLDLPPINEEKPIIKKPILEKAVSDANKKKRRMPVFLWILLVLLIGSGIYVGLNYDSLKQHIPFLADNNKQTTNSKESENHKDDTPTNESRDSSDDDSADVSDDNQAINENDTQDTSAESPQETETTSTFSSSNSGFSVDKNLPFQVIVGSFSEKSNADRKVKSLKNAGFAPEIIGQYDGLYFVSLGSFNSMAEVKAKTAEISEVGSYWVFKK